MLLTGIDDVEDVAGAAGADALLLKPFRPLELLGVVERLAGARVGRADAQLDGPLREEQLLLYARDLRHLVEIERAQRGLLESAYRRRSPRSRARSGRRTPARASTRSACSATRWSSRARSIPTLAATRARVRLPAPRHRQDRRSRPDPPQAGLAERGRVARDAGAHPARRADDRRRRLPARGGRRDRPLAPRALGRHGYPDGLAGEEIPLGARIFAVADALDAITNHRPYREARSWRVAPARSSTQTGKQFDPQVVDAFRDREHVLHEIRREFLAAA